MAVGFQVTFDAHDPARLAEFWATALRYQIQPPPEGYDSWEAVAAAIGIPEHRWGDWAGVTDPEGNEFCVQ